MKVSCKLILSVSWEWSNIPKVPKIASFQCLNNKSKKELEIKRFCMLINIKVFYKVKLSLMMCMIKHSQSTYSNKLPVTLQYLKKEVSH